jgi:hypothetical protein
MSNRLGDFFFKFCGLFRKQELYLFHKQSTLSYFKFHAGEKSSGYWFKKNEFTIIVFESADPYLPDRVEFKYNSLCINSNNTSDAIWLHNTS